MAPHQARQLTAGDSSVSFKESQDNNKPPVNLISSPRV